VGKTVAAVNDLVLRALYNPRQHPRYAYIAPFYRQAKDVAWQYLKDSTQSFARRVRESDLRVELFNDAYVTLYGADNPDALRGLYLDGVVLDEYGDTKPSLWPEVVLPTLADRRGFAVFIGTAKGKNHFHATVVRARTSPHWFHRTFKASETHVLPPEELQELREQMSAAQYARELECDFDAAVPGTYYADLITDLERSQHIHPTRYPPDLNYPVHVAADLGFSDSTAFWFWQVLPDGPRVIDYYENQSKPLAHYVTHLRAKPYRYDTLWLPHDARAHTLQTGRTTVEQLQQDNFNVRIAPNVRVQHGIDAGRYVLPRLTINSSACYSGIEALRAYRRRYDEKNKAYADTPLHDWSSNGADAFRYMSLVVKMALKVELPPLSREVSPDTMTLGWTLQELFDEHDQRRMRLNEGRV
jgi:hypothetical protein